MPLQPSVLDNSCDLWNYVTEQFEQIDSRNAMQFLDVVTTIEAGGDVSRFVEPGTGCVEARVRFESAKNARQQFAANIDQVLWSIEK